MSQKSLSLTYLLRPSSIKSEKAPALFMFHGYGSNEEDLFSFASELPEELMIFSVKAPYDLEPFGHAWYAINFDAEQGKWSDDEQAKESREKIVSFMDEAIEVYNLDKENITLLGGVKKYPPPASLRWGGGIAQMGEEIRSQFFYGACELS